MSRSNRVIKIYGTSELRLTKEGKPFFSSTRGREKLLTKQTGSLDDFSKALKEETEKIKALAGEQQSEEERLTQNQISREKPITKLLEIYNNNYIKEKIKPPQGKEEMER